MARTGLPGKRRGFSAYIYSELEERHVRFLKLFLSFIEWKFKSVPEYWTWLLPLLVDDDPVDVAQLSEEEQKKLFVAFTMFDLHFIHSRCGQAVDKILEEADAGKEIPLKGMEFKVRLRETRSGRKVFEFSPKRPAVFDQRSIGEYLLARFRFCLMHLDRDAILECDQCHRYFLRADQREARHCSQACRLRAWDAVRAEKRAAESKGRRRG